MTHPSLAVLVLLSCAISNTPWSPFAVVRATWVGIPESQFLNRIELFEHVLRNDDRWSPVLNQLVKLSNLTLPKYRVPEPYKDELKELQLVPEGAKEAMAGDVIKNLMDETPWSGTNVNYTAKVLSTAVTCFTYSNVSYVLSLLKRIGELKAQLTKSPKKDEGKKDGSSDEEKKDKYEIGDALDDVRMTLVVLADKVAAVDGDLVLLASGLYDYDGGMYGKDKGKKTNKDLVQLLVLQMMKEDVDEKMVPYCNRTPDTDVHQYLVDYGSLNATPSTGELAPDAELKHELAEFRKVVNSMIDIYDGLNVETMAMETWLRIIDYKVPFLKNIKFYIGDQVKIPSRQTESWSKRLKTAFLLANEEVTDITDEEGQKSAEPQHGSGSRSKRRNRRRKNKKKIKN